MNKNTANKELLYVLYCAGIMAMNILAAKQIDIWCFTVTCGIFTSGLVFVAQDLMTEQHGEKESKKMILTCYIVALAMTVLYQISININGSQFWHNQNAYSTILKTTLRITIASFVAYTCGSLVNVHIMGKLKKKFPKLLFIRALSSTLVGQILDNGLFAVIAFAGVLPWKAILTMTVGGTLIEIATEILVFPVLKIFTKKNQIFKTQEEAIHNIEQN